MYFGKYLGRKLTFWNPHQIEIESRIAAGLRKFYSFKQELTSPCYSLNDRLRLFQGVVTPNHELDAMEKRLCGPKPNAADEKYAVSQDSALAKLSENAQLLQKEAGQFQLRESHATCMRVAQMFAGLDGWNVFKAHIGGKAKPQRWENHLAVVTGTTAAVETLAEEPDGFFLASLFAEVAVRHLVILFSIFIL